MPIHIVNISDRINTDANAIEKKSHIFGINYPAKVKTVFLKSGILLIETVVPKKGNNAKAEKAIELCYKKTIDAAKENDIKSISVPLFAAKEKLFSADKLMKIAVKAISECIADDDMSVYLTVEGKNTLFDDNERLKELNSYISSQMIYEEEKRVEALKTAGTASFRDTNRKARSARRLEEAECDMAPAVFAIQERELLSKPNSLISALEQIDESFSEMLLRKIDESGMTDAECYKKANIDRKLFSKIRSDRLYKPSKPTAIAFAVSLELSLEETKEMLMKAGFALSHSNKFDIIIEYFISNGIYDIFEINEALFAFDQNLLGA